MKRPTTHPMVVQVGHRRYNDDSRKRTNLALNKGAYAAFRISHDLDRFNLLVFSQMAGQQAAQLGLINITR